MQYLNALCSVYYTRCGVLEFDALQPGRYLQTFRGKYCVHLQRSLLWRGGNFPSI